ncbi:MAG: hypothetical protein VB133_01940 [Anaeromusa sp.]|uniref:hypothetical protein n=1 Tax=Anaeromusa sp. TaxID=1872520 RepID=UPI0026186075|nr:hypothetical protein [Anaeromusa sp.]MDD3158889.1 hypothetical protein [Anaeromusa sp.]MEA4833890.1 hypothetical protein [Anaeromusa sp.]
MIAVVDVAFFLIISFIVLLMAFLVALLSKRFPQWQLSWKIVLFCAGCAILLAAVLPRLLLSWANLEMTVAILFVCAVGGAWAAAKLPDCMPVMSAAAVSPVAAEASAFSLTVSEKQQEEANTGEFWMDRQKEPLPKKEETQEQSLAIRKKKALKAPKKEPAVAGALAADPAGEERLPIRRKKKAPVRAKNMDNAAPQTAIEPVTIKMPEAEHETSPITETTIEPATAKMPETSPITETTIELATAKMPEAEPEKTATIAAAEDLPAASALASSMTEEPKEISAPEKPDFVEKTEEIPAAFVNVDACLEEAWRFREAGSWQTAQQVLQAGITQFADDEELPFLLIEEGALLKRYGRWEEAIAALEAALALPQVRCQPVWQKDIQQTLGYLQIFLGVLRQLKLEAVAPEAIPASVLDKVEAIYQQWRSRQ